MKIMTTFVKFQLCYRFYFLVKTNGKYCVDVFRKKNLKNGYGKGLDFTRIGANLVNCSPTVSIAVAH